MLVSQEYVTSSSEGIRGYVRPSPPSQPKVASESDSINVVEMISIFSSHVVDRVSEDFVGEGSRPWDNAPQPQSSEVRDQPLIANSEFASHIDQAGIQGNFNFEASEKTVGPFMTTEHALKAIVIIAVVGLTLKACDSIWRKTSCYLRSKGWTKGLHRAEKRKQIACIRFRIAVKKTLVHQRYKRLINT